MRIKYMYYLTKNNLELVKASTPQPHTNSTFQINDRKKVVKALIDLSVISIYRDPIKDIFNIGVSAKDGDEFYSNSDKSKYTTSLNILVRKMEMVINICEEAGFDKNANGFDIRLPPTKDFSEFAKYIKDLEFIFSQCPYLTDSNERIEIKSVDNGSIWIEFVVIATGSAVILNNLASIVNKCMKIKSNYLTCKQQEEQLRAMKLKNDELEKLLKTFDVLRDGLIQKCKDELSQEIRKPTDGEEEEKIDKTLKSLSQMMNNGLEIVASLDTPKEVKDLFPTSDEIKALPELPKLFEK